MERQDLRVIVASEYPEVQDFLKWMVEREGQAIIVGQAENAIGALALARNLTPDVAVIDCHLPHAVGLDNVALSRLGGLDTAQNISENVPNTEVILLNSLDKVVLPKDGQDSDDVAFFSRDVNGINTSFTLEELYDRPVSPSSLVFADVKVKQRVALQRKTTNIGLKTVSLVVLGTLGGLLLILTLSIGGGIFLALAGAAAVFLGLAGKLAVSLWRRMKRRIQIELTG